jgi:hypothetical protein
MGQRGFESCHTRRNFVDTTTAGRQAEQKAMNEEGGVQNLDNKRNEIREKDWKANGVQRPKGNP